MHIEQIYTGCLNEAAYFIVSNGEAAIFDPMPDTDRYYELFKRQEATIKYIFETNTSLQPQSMEQFII